MHGCPQAKFIQEFLVMDMRGTVPKSEVYPKLFSKLGVRNSQVCQDMLAEYNQSFRQFARPFPGLEDLKEGLVGRRLPVGIVTNGNVIGQTATLNALGLGKFFQACLISESEGIRKPDIEIFLRAADRLDTEPMECVFIGDNPSVDIAGAQKAGMKTIWFPNGAIWPASLAWGPDAEINSLAEVLGLLDQWCD